jgi:CBS domain-containing protein
MTAPVADLMSRKVVSVDSASSAYDVARDMLDHDIGCVVVLENKKVIGIATKSDIIREAVMKRLDPQKITVASLMTKMVVTIEADKSLSEASAIMSKNNITKLPVIERGELIGIITSTDLVRRTRPIKLAKDLV